MATAKKSAKKPAKKPAKQPAKKPAKKAAVNKPAKKPAKKAAVKKPVKKALPKKPIKKVPAKKPAPAPKKVAATRFVPAPHVPAARPVATMAPPPRVLERKPPPKKAPPPPPPQRPPVKGVTKDGIAYTKDFDAKWLTSQRALLVHERASVLGQAVRLEEEANQIIEEQEMGDVQFDDEGGEGDTMVVERERDLALGAQARQTVADIDGALERLKTGAYGYSVESARPIPRDRLEAIPWATVLVEEKVGGIGRL